MGYVDRNFSTTKYILRMVLAAILIILIATVPEFVGWIVFVCVLVFAYLFFKPNSMSYKKYTIRYLLVVAGIALSLLLIRYLRNI